MPAYNFIAKVVPPIRTGTKQLTIRKKRKRPTVEGDTLYLYTNMRNRYKPAELLLKTKCAVVLQVLITADYIKLTYGRKAIYLYYFTKPAHRFVALDGLSTYSFIEIHSAMGNMDNPDMEVIYWGKKNFFKLFPELK